MPITVYIITDYIKLSQETTDQLWAWLDEKAEDLSNLMLKCASSGYSQAQREDILLSGMEGYSRMTWRERIQSRRINKPKGEGRERRAARKLVAKSSWFNRSAQRMNDEEEDVPWNESRKSTSEEAVCTYQPEGRRQEEGKEKTRKKSLAQPSSRKNTPVWEAAMFVPATGGSLLRKTLQKLDNQFAALHKEPGVKMVEQGGTMLSSILTKADPWGGAPCGREECFPCSSAGEGKGGKCYRENVLYKLV